MMMVLIQCFRYQSSRAWWALQRTGVISRWRLDRLHMRTSPPSSLPAASKALTVLATLDNSSHSPVCLWW